MELSAAVGAGNPDASDDPNQADASAAEELGDPPANQRERRRISLELSQRRIAHIDRLKREWGLNSRGGVVERLLDDIFDALDGPLDGEAAGGDPGGPSPAGLQVDPTGAGGGPVSAAYGDHGLEPEPTAGGNGAGESGGDLDEDTALVLVPGSGLTGPPLDLWEEDSAGSDRRGGREAQVGGGIDLPGFVRRRSNQIGRSLRTTQPTLAPMPRVAEAVAEEAEQAARQHWLDLYGTPPSATVLEAAMVWLGRDIWPEADQSEGRAFTWSLANLVMSELIPDWQELPPSFERVMLVAGVLQDPFSAASLPLRMPTLIRGFVHRFRRRRSATSFQTLEHTMTLQGALKLLQLPTDPGRRLSLAQIREAYRDLAMRHHPDSGGSVETMRRLNEAYQLLKELYRQRG